MKHCFRCSREIPEPATACGCTNQRTQDADSRAVENHLFADDGTNRVDASDVDFADESLLPSLPPRSIEAEPVLFADEASLSTAKGPFVDGADTAAFADESAASTLKLTSFAAARAQFDDRPAAAEVSFAHDGTSRRTILAVVGGVFLGAAATLVLLISKGGSTEAAAHAVTRPASRSALAPNSPPAFGHKWNRADRDWVDGQRNAFAFELRSETKVPIWQRQAQPVLVVRCVSHRTEAFVFIESAAKMEAQDENHPVRISFDGGPEETQRWPDSADHDALFAPDSAAFVQRLARAQTLRFGYTPHNAEPVATEFHVAGFTDLIAPMAKRCGSEQNH